MQTSPASYHAHPPYAQSHHISGEHSHALSNGRTSTGSEMYPNQHPYQQPPPPAHQPGGYQYYSRQPSFSGQAPGAPPLPQYHQHQSLPLPPASSLAQQPYYSPFQPPPPHYANPYQITVGELARHASLGSRPSGSQSSASSGPRELSKSLSDDRYTYELEVVQQPQRARMCGFGDKDRRPLTPPPCVRLIVRDKKTKEEVDPSDVDGSFFVLTVDLYNEAATKESNIVQANSGNAGQAISTATTTSYPPAPERAMPSVMAALQQAVNMGSHVPLSGPLQFTANISYPPHAETYPPAAYPALGGPPTLLTHSTPPASLFTRNLIGSLAVNATPLEDTEHKRSYWFVLQDLSVRTEGIFRLKMSFVNVGINLTSTPEGGKPIRGKAPVLAWCFSEPFHVFSAKRFPGVIESTELSKCFSAQGIKIPIRKDTGGGGGGGRDGREDGSDDEGETGG